MHMKYSVSYMHCTLTSVSSHPGPKAARYGLVGMVITAILWRHITKFYKKISFHVKKRSFIDFETLIEH